jgi:hypothetical protein
MVLLKLTYVVAKEGLAAEELVFGLNPLILKDPRIQIVFGSLILKV